MSHESELLGHRYTLQKHLGRGAMGAVYQARDRLTHQLVALKRVEVAAQSVGAQATDTWLHSDMVTQKKSPSPAPRVSTKSSITRDVLRLYHLALAHEFRTLSSLRHPHVVSVLDYGFFDGQPYFTMELLRNCQTLREAAQSRTLAQKLELLSQVLLALIYLHRRGVLHRDLKPSNVLCVGDWVKVVDFGVATAIGNDRNIAGTVEYMAPEVLLGKRPSPASDLYSFGVMACELLSGQYPFDRTTATRFLWNILEPQDLAASHERLSILEALCRHMPMSMPGDDTPPQQPLHTADALARVEPPALRAVVQRLMARSAAERFASAEEALAALAEATGASYGSALEGTRESFLQAARLVGRDHELEQLESALDAASQGRGGAWLVGGESGVGKSRLLDELRALALVRGVRVVRGQAQRSGGAAYREWGEVLRPLCLNTRLSDLEASVLWPLLGDLEEILERRVAEAPPLEPKATQQRLINSVLDVVLRQDGPTLLILEDIHWSSPESVSLLRRLLEQIADHPLLIVASYRDDERGSLPQELPQSQHLRLGRLGRTHLAELSASMLGDAGRNQELLSFLEKESEGNTFFMIEVVRALAEEAGSLQAVGQARLPAALATGGIQAVLSRRLLRVPAKWRGLISTLAVAGRQIDLRLLNALEPKTEEFLQQCANVAVLEMVEQEWRFSHDKLRETALSSLSQKTRQALHAQVAASLERAYPDPSTQAARLAYHHKEAANPAEAARYAAIAGEQARRAGAMREAAAHLQQALSYYDASLSPALPRARLRRLLLDCNYVLGQMDEVVQNGQRALALLELPFPEKPSALRWALIQHTLEFLAALYGLAPHRACSPGEELRLHELTELAWTSTVALNLLGMGKHSLLMTLMWERAARRINSCDGQLMAISSMAVGLRLAGQRGLAARCLAKARQLLPRSAVRSQGPFLMTCLIFELMDGRFREATAQAETVRTFCRQQGDVATEGYAASLLTGALLVAGQLAETPSRIARVRRLAQRSESVQFLAAADSLEATLLIYRGEPVLALEKCATALALARQASDKRSEVSALGLCGLAQLHAGKAEEALATAEKVLTLLEDNLLNNLAFVESATAPAEIFLTLWQTGFGDGRRIRQGAHRAVARLERSSAARPMNRPRFLLWSGVLAGLKGQRQAQRGLLEQAIALSERMEAPLEEGRACMELGRSLGPADAAGSAYIRRAKELFRHAGATALLKKAEALPGHVSPA